MTLKIQKKGDDLFVVLPADIVSQLGWGHGDILAPEIVDGNLKIVRTQTAHEHALEIAHKVMDEYHDALAALANS